MFAIGDGMFVGAEGREELGYGRELGGGVGVVGVSCGGGIGRVVMGVGGEGHLWAEAS